MSVTVAPRDITGEEDRQGAGIPYLPKIRKKIERNICKTIFTILTILRKVRVFILFFSRRLFGEKQVSGHFLFALGHVDAV